MIVGLDIKNKKMECSQCDNEIHNKYYRFDQYNKIYCASCYLKSFKCQVCGLPTHEAYLVQDLKICNDCYSLKYSCKSCSRELKQGEYQFINGINGFFCSSCARSQKKCSRCSFPVYTQDKLLKVDEELFLCESCQSNSVLTEEVANNILQNIARILNVQMGIQIVKNITLDLSTKREMKHKCFDTTSESVSKDDLENIIFGFTKKDGKKIHITILIGLSLNSFISILTHEYARSWQLDYCSRYIGQVIWKGFAEWVATKMLWLLGYHNEIKKIENSINKHGFGLRKIQVIEKSRGTQGVLEFMAQVK